MCNNSKKAFLTKFEHLSSAKEQVAPDMLEQATAFINECPFPSILMRFGQHMLTTGKVALAQQCFEKVQKTMPQNPIVAPWLALSILIQNMSSHQPLDISVKQPKISDTQYLVLLAKSVEAYWLEHGELFATKHLIPHEHSPISVNDASMFAKNGRWQDIFDGLYSIKHKNDDIHFALAIASEMLGDYEFALSMVEKIEKENIQLDYVKATKARVLIRLERFAEAVALLSTIQITGPEDYGACYYWGIIALAYDEQEIAERFFKLAFNEHAVDTVETILPQIYRQLNA